MASQAPALTADEAASVLYSLAALGWRDEGEAILQLRNHLAKTHVFKYLSGYGMMNLHRSLTGLGIEEE